MKPANGLGSPRLAAEYFDSARLSIYPSKAGAGWSALHPGCLTEDLQPQWPPACLPDYKVYGAAQRYTIPEFVDPGYVLHGLRAKVLL